MYKLNFLHSSQVANSTGSNHTSRAQHEQFNKLKFYEFTCIISTSTTPLKEFHEFINNRISYFKISIS